MSFQAMASYECEAKKLIDHEWRGGIIVGARRLCPSRAVTQLPEQETAMPPSTIPLPSKNVKDITGEKFGRWTVLEFSHIANRRSHWECECQCGTKSILPSNRLHEGVSKSCGCWQRERAGEISRIHGYAAKRKNRIPEYACWVRLKQRCTNKNDRAYKNYGGRGIKVCERWLNSFPNFLEDMGRKPSPELSIDRINNDGDYESSNCRWATRNQQQSNRRCCKKYKKT